MRYDYSDNDKFNSIEVTLSMGCKIDCRYCPQKILLDQYYKKDKNRCKKMSFENFKKILEQVKSGGTICFSGMCEPFFNDECDEMIAYAHEQGYRIMLLTTLVGFRKESIHKLRHIDFDGITLHIPDKEGNSKFDITDEYLEVLKLFHENFKVGSYSCHGTTHPAVEPYINTSVMRSSKMMNRAGNLECGDESNPLGEIVCMVGTIGSYGNWAPEVLPDGTVVLCCMDYAMKHVLGNLLTMTAKEILEGKEYLAVQEGMRDDSKDILCRKCSAALEVMKMPAYHFYKKKLQYESKENDGISENQLRIIECIEESDNVCVFGLGKLFWDNFFHQRWNEVLQCSYFVDNNPDLWGENFDGIACISPDELSNISNPVVITHMTDDYSVREQLKTMGINRVINIKDVYLAF